MKPNAIRAFILLGAVLVTAALNLAIVGKERIKTGGELAYLPLAPVDPRSLMQGDYMALRFELAQQLERSESPTAVAAREGAVRFAQVVLDDRRIANVAEAGHPNTANALRLRYRIRHGHVWLGTNAFFFEEGSAQRFSSARYGEFRIDRATGEAVLVGLRNAALEAL